MRLSDLSLLAFLYDSSRDEVEDQFGQGSGSKAEDLSYRFGVELNRNRAAGLAAVAPAGEALNTHTYTPDGDLTNDYLVSRLEKTLRLNPQLSSTSTESGSDSDGVSTSSHSYSCPDAESGWHCLGRTHQEEDRDPYGQIEKFVRGAKAQDENNSTLDYFSFEVQQTITPGISDTLNWSDWQNDYIYRMVDFRNENGLELVKHGPDTQGGNDSSGFEAGVSVGITSSEVGVGGNLGWSWSTTYSHTKIKENTDVTDEQTSHEYNFKMGETVAKNSMDGYPGYRVDVNNGTDVVRYYHETDWRWVKNCGWFCTDHHTYGDGEWYA